MGAGLGTENLLLTTKKMSTLFIKGNITIATAIITATATILASGLAAWGSASAKNAELEGDVRVVEERENNHYAETQRQLKELNEKMDRLLVKNGITLNN